MTYIQANANIGWHFFFMRYEYYNDLALVLLLLGKSILLVFHELITNSFDYLMKINSSLFFTSTT